ncbi:MAG: hypothetical protein HC886_08465 [Leptolyngbyaceae cyanobacterium SM1_1_3]|nr:hypothetical protein [Leptolyngbyaceae cyanobacterium SM1_1_3]
MGDILRISDLTLPAGVIAVADLEKSVVTVLSPTVGAESEAETELVDLVIQPEATDAANADTAK